MADDRDKLEHEIARLRAVEVELTARAVRAEEELRASRAVHAATIESLPFDFWARDPEGYCFSQNSTTLGNWGNLLNQRPEDMGLPPQVLEAWLANNGRALAGEIVRGDAEYVLHGETRYIHNILAPIRMGEAITGTLGVNIDVTERRRALLALRESEEKLRMAAEIAGLGLWTWDPVSDEIVWEPALSAIFGLEAGTFPATRDAYMVLVHTEDRERVAARVPEWVASSRWEDEYRVVRADGAIRWVMVKTRVLRDGDRTRVVGAVIDVTERKRRDEQLRQAQKLEAVGQLTAGIAHNFNNMLMGVLPNLELAVRRAPAGLLPLLDGASTSARRAAELVRRLLTYAGRNRPTERTTEEVTLLVARAVELCRTTFDKRITLDQDYRASSRALVDATQIEQAVLNVLINARDALENPTLEEPRVSISVGIVPAGAEELAGRAGDHVRVRIGDNGSGMDAATVARIYEPFFTTKEVGKGTGLGLATTHAIFNEHGGFTVCESVPGHGTVFSLYLPSDLAAARQGEHQEPAEEVQARGTETVLVIDDEPAIRRVVGVMLEGAGYVVRQAASGSEALELLAAGELASEIALVLLDVSMPGPPRRELRERLRELTRARIVYFTGYALDAADADPDDTVLEKPVTEERLLRTIRRILDGA